MQIIIKLRDGKIIKACIFNLFSDSISLHDKFFFPYNIIKEFHVYLTKKAKRYNKKV